MNYLPIALLGTLGLLVAIVGLMDLGRRVGVWRLARQIDNADSAAGTVDGAIFALLGLLLAFTFSGAAARFDVRRQLVVEEANDIGTAYLRLDLLPASAQPGLRETFRRYVDSRIRLYQKVSDPAAVRQELATGADLQQQIWTQAVAACRSVDSPPPTMLLLPAINQMIDITTTRTVASQTHPPAAVYAMLFTLILASSFLVGHGMARGKHRDWVHTLGFAIVMSAAVYVILDYEFPRFGLIRIDTFDQVLVDVRDTMK